MTDNPNDPALWKTLGEWLCLPALLATLLALWVVGEALVEGG